MALMPRVVAYGSHLFCHSVPSWQQIGAWPNLLRIRPRPIALAPAPPPAGNDQLRSKKRRALWPTAASPTAPCSHCGSMSMRVNNETFNWVHDGRS